MTAKLEKGAVHMARFWVSWKTGNYEDEGCRDPPFQGWWSGRKKRLDGSGRTDETHEAVFDAEDEMSVWAFVSRYYPDFRAQFCKARKDGWLPGKRFVNPSAYRITEEGSERLSVSVAEAVNL